MLTNTLFLATMAILSSTVLASPTGRSSSTLNLLNKRSSYECPGPAPSCQTCQTQENRCIALAAGPVYEEVRSCIAQAQLCYFDAENANIYGRYSCDSAYATCIADGGDEIFCGKQQDACAKCETGYDSCRGCLDCVTTDACQSQSVLCFRQAVTLNGTVTPRSPDDA